MKEKIYALLVLVLFVVVLHFCSTVESQYTKMCTVTKVEGEKVLVVDDSGEGWEFYKPNFTVGEKVNVVFDNCHTDKDFTDDIIKDVRKINK